MAADAARRLDVEAPAKINLGLRVTGRRADGYHRIESLFVPVDLVDDVRVELRDGTPGRVAIDVGPGDAVVDPTAGPGVGAIDASAVPTDERNLAVAAARAFLAAAVERCGVAPDALPEVRLTLRKRIPAAAGLGGGSSDAGAVLRALASLLPAGPQAASLADVALGLGADVPFFLAPAPALATGIGECLTPVPDLPALPLLLVNPGASVSTADVYRLFDVLRGEGGGPPALTPDDPGSTMRPPSGADAAEDALSRLLDRRNDLEPAAVRLCPAIARLRNRLRDLGARSVGMSGSGATVYGVFRSVSAARDALEAARFEPPTWARVVRSRSSGSSAEHGV